MDLNGMGLLGAIIVGGLAGWLAEQFMKSNMGILMNIVLGIIGAAALNFLLSVLGIYTGTGILIYLIVGFIGACILIAIGRAVRR
ncbi:GlsB/YeaQ/YmgE family stress response membrane protein [Mesorhizobium sp. CAU 1732]|uniref:GlsB/YeaQ/YmgE family stress response membrane protein n=1 Tax=Mesorhizobium sp. CAU 1732 TaxID=3140358 RepID=UPI003260A281